MTKPEHQIFVCASFRFSGEPQGVCHKKGAGSLLGYLETEISDRGLDGVVVTSTGCLKACDRGPIMVVYPENDWYAGVNEGVIDAVLDSLENGSGPVEKFLLK